MRAHLDARVRKTKGRLGHALVMLMHEKPFDAITIQDVLERADVGRSTFYVHYRDKHDLLRTESNDFYEAISMWLARNGEDSDRIAPVKEFFAHIAQMRWFIEAMRTANLLHESMDRARLHFARGIARRMDQLPRAKDIPRGRLPAIAAGHAGMMISMMQWWLDHEQQETPEAMDDLFHRLVWGGATNGQPAAIDGQAHKTQVHLH